MLAPAEEQDVDDDVGAGVGAEAALGQPDRRDQIGATSRCARAPTRRALSIVPCEVTKAASAPGFRRPIARAMK